MPLAQPRSFRPTTALAKSVDFCDEMMHVTLTDGRVISTPVAWFPTLLHATAEQRANWRIGGHGVGLHWPDLDEDLLVAGLLGGGEDHDRVARTSFHRSGQITAE